jgi:hypothetical protein
MLSLIDTKEIRPAQAALALNLVSEMDFLRLKAVARLYSRGLPPDVDWDDLLQEAFTRVLVGAQPDRDGALHRRHHSQPAQRACKRMRRCLLREGLTCAPK